MGEPAKLSKLGQYLKANNVTQKELLDRIVQMSKGQIVISKSALSLQVNAKREFMTTDTCKIYAKALGCRMEDIC